MNLKILMPGTRTALLPLLLSLAGGAARAAGSSGPEPGISTRSAAPAETVLPPVISAVPAPPPRYSVEISSALKHLSALLDKGSLVDQKGLDEVAKEIGRLDARVRDLLGPSILRELEEREKESMSKAPMAAAKTELVNVRTALMAYYGDTEGAYPESPAALIPSYLPAMPLLELPGHAVTGAVELSTGTGPDDGRMVHDTGGWLYFNDPKSPSFGMLLINCTHKDDQNVELYKY